MGVFTLPYHSIPSTFVLWHSTQCQHVVRFGENNYTQESISVDIHPFLITNRNLLKRHKQNVKDLPSPQTRGVKATRPHM